MKKESELRDEFLKELAALLDKYSSERDRASIVVEEKSCMGGWASYGILSVNLPSIYKDDECIQQYLDIDLGTRFDSSDVEAQP